MGNDQPLTPEAVAHALDAARRAYQRERRARFVELGVPADCPWPASRIFHEHSSLDVTWQPELTVEEVEHLTLSPPRSGRQGRRLRLPEPLAVEATLTEALQGRRSVRQFSGCPLGVTDVATLLGHACGVTAHGDVAKRAAPSGGALFPVQTYLLNRGVTDVQAGLHQYDALGHSLTHLRPEVAPEELQRALPPGLADAQAPLVVVLSAVFARTQRKYLERGYRFALLEAGHIAQNLCLVATAQGLGSVCVGGFWDEPLNAMLDVDPAEEAALYCVLVGRSPR